MMCRRNPDAWIASDRTKQQKQDAEQACLFCPTLLQCREMAAGFYWCDVTVAAWSAPRTVRAKPPWA